MAPRVSKGDDTSTRTALLDATSALMLEEGYAAVTTRRLAARSGINNALVHYYFKTMDDLFIELFRRGAQQSFERQSEVLASAQPLWALWDDMHDPSRSAVTMEFIALANHRKAIRAEIADYSRKFRALQLESLASILEGYGLDPDEWSPATVILLMSSISRFLLIEEAFDLDLGHADMVTLVERHITALEGARRPRQAQRPGTRAS
jgi:AcrR family transcriptional regulator